MKNLLTILLTLAFSASAFANVAADKKTTTTTEAAKKVDAVGNVVEEKTEIKEEEKK